MSTTEIKNKEHIVYVDKYQVKTNDDFLSYTFKIFNNENQDYVEHNPEEDQANFLAREAYKRFHNAAPNYRHVTMEMWHEFCTDNTFPPPLGKEDVDIQEIGNALSRTFRYGGRSEISVDIHSLKVAQIAKRNVSGSHLKQVCYQAGLMHDVHEVWTGDILWPVKKMIGFPFSKELEQRINSYLYPIFGLEEYLVFDTEFQSYVSHCDYLANEEELKNNLKVWNEDFPNFTEELKTYF